MLDRLERYEIREGDRLQDIADAFELLPETLERLNPALATGGDRLPVGETILVPPFNGVRVEIPAGATWQDVAAAYGVRADALFELNGCQPQPRVIFLPGIRWAAREASPENYTGLATRPLPGAPVAIGRYGLQPDGTFHSGLDLAAAPGTPVRATEPGEVVFAGENTTYGNLVAIDHAGQRQTRYAHLDRVDVAVGQRVEAGTIVGTTGTTGQPDTSQPHLHFEVRFQTSQGWVSQDPSLHLVDN